MKRRAQPLPEKGRLLRIEFNDRTWHFRRPTTQRHLDLAEWVASPGAQAIRRGRPTSAQMFAALLWSAEILEALWAHLELELEVQEGDAAAALEDLRDELSDLEIAGLALQLANAVRLPYLAWCSIAQAVQASVNFTQAPPDSDDTSPSAAGPNTDSHPASSTPSPKKSGWRCWLATAWSAVFSRQRSLP